MDLALVKGDIQKLIAVNANRISLTVDLALGLIGAYMLKKYNSGIKDWKAMENFLKYLRNECFKGKKHSFISEYTFSNCTLFILKFLSLQPFERKKETLISFGLKVIAQVNNNGYLSYYDKTFNAYASQIIIDGMPVNNYVIEDLATENNISEDCDVITDSSVVETNSNNNTIVEQEVITPDNSTLQNSDNQPHKQNNSNDNSPFIKLYDELKLANPKNRSEGQFAWQWLLSLDEYNAIKECVGTNKIPSPKKWDSRTVRLLALYIGEFYKREYENNLTPFTQLGENSSNYEFNQYTELCEFLNIESYKKESSDHTYTFYWYTLYVSGGLPVHFISTKLDNDKSNSFIDGLSKLFDAEDGLDIVEGEELLKKTNTALRESYHNHHSIFEYIQALLKDEKTWHDSDNENEEFCEFIEKVKNAKKKARERKKFKVFYSLWTYLDNSNIKEFYITPQLRFNPEEDGERHYAISKQRLENWGIKNPPAQFSLKIGDTSIIFTICYNGDYISRGMVDRIDLPILDKNLEIEDLSNPNYTIIYDDLRDEPCCLKKDFYLPFKDGYMQLYTDDDPSMASWNSYKGAHAFRWSGVLYDKNRYQLLSQNTIIDINEQIGWVTFADSVTFEDTNKGKIHTFFNSKGSIYAKPSNNSLHTIIINSPCLLEGCIIDGQAECAIGDEQGKAYIVKSNGIMFDVFRAADDEKVDFSTVVVYKSASDYRDFSIQWKEYDSKKTSLAQGLYVFRLSRDRYMTEVKCYVLPLEANISFYNHSQPYLIKFNGIIDVTSDGIVTSQKEDRTEFRISNNSDKYIFTLGDGDEHITLQTYHPKAQIHLYLHGHEITDKPIIMAYAEDIEVNYISTQSCNKPKCRLSDYTEAYKRLFGALTATALGKRTKLLTQAHSIKLDERDEKSKLMIRVYTQEISQNMVGSVKMMLLDLEKENNDLRQISSIPTKVDNDSLLFQSLKDVRNTDVYFAPKFVSHSGIGAASDVKKIARQKKLTAYANKENQKSFASDWAYKQFEIACEHKIYFAVFDPLLGMCWDVKNKTFLDTTKTKFKKNLLCFLQGYVDYNKKYSHEPCIAGLKRLAREFLFDWKILKKDINNSLSQQLKELYQEIINN